MAKARIAFTPAGGAPLELEPFAGGTGIFMPREGIDGFFPVPQYDENFAESPDTEGGHRTQSRAKNATGSASVVVSGSNQQEFERYYGEWQQLVETMRRFGGTLTYQPAEGESVTYLIESMHINSVPYDGVQLLGWVQAYEFEFTCLPYGLLPEEDAILSDTDRFKYDSITNSDWTLESGTLIESGSGSLTVGSTAAKKLYRSGLLFADGSTAIKVTPVTSASSGSTRLRFKRLNELNMLYAIVNFSGATSKLSIAKLDTAVESTLETGGTFTATAGQPLWLVQTISGNSIHFYAYKEDPEANPKAVPVSEVSHTLTAGNAAKYGSGVWGNVGLEVAPANTSWFWNGWKASALSVRATKPLAGFEVGDVRGDVDALGTMLFTERSGQSRKHLEVGLEAGGVSYDETVAPPNLIDSATLETSGFVGTAAVVSGAYNEKAITAKLTTYAVSVCGVSGIHTGQYRPRVRIKNTNGETGDKVWVRMSWTGPAGVQRSVNDYSMLPTYNTWCDVDLGVINIPPAPEGAQHWEGQIEAYATTTKGTSRTIAVDYIEMVGATKWARSSVSVDTSVPAAVKARDDFGSDAEGVLNGKELSDKSGKWTTATYGEANAQDFTVLNTSETVRYIYRSEYKDKGTQHATPPVAKGPLWAAQVDVYISAFPKAKSIFKGEIFGGLGFTNEAGGNSACGFYYENMWTGSENEKGELIGPGEYYSARWFDFFGSFYRIESLAPATWYTITMLAVGGSYALGWWRPQGAAITSTPNFIAPLSTTEGKPEIWDASNGIRESVTRRYDNFICWVPTLDSSLFANRSAKLRSGDAIRQNAAGTSWGPMPNYEGSRMRIPPATSRGLTSRVSFKGRRTDVETISDENISDTLEASLRVTPRVVLLG